MSRRPLLCRRMLAALGCAGLLLAPPPARSDTCIGLSLNALPPALVGTTPNAVAVGDFNRDGRMDVAVVNSGSNDVSIMLGNGSGSFTPTGPAIGTGGGSNPVDIAAGDLDRDGFLDLVVAFGGSAQAKVLRGLAAGAFDNTPAPFPLNAFPTRIYLADFTQDGDLDLVVVAEAGQRLLLYGGAAGFGFAGAALTNINLAPIEQPSGGAVLDFNRDGKLDLAVVMRNVSIARVYYGNGTGGLSPGPPAGLGAAAGPRDIAAGDVNRDGWPDVVSANSTAATASVLLNVNGSSLSLQVPAVAVGGVPLRVALGHLDDDGVLDLAVLDDSATPRVAAFQGLSTGTPWFSTSAAAAALPPGAGLRGLGVGRFTADGRLDLVTALSGPQQVVAIENQSGTPCARSSFAGAPRSYPAGDRPVSTAAADFDEDGRQDLAVVSGSDFRIRILRNANADFPALTTIGPLASPPTAVATADLNVDGHADVVVARGDPGPGLVQVYLGNGLGGLAAGVVQSAGPGANFVAVVIGDFNGDGAPDVAAAAAGLNSVFVFLGDGAGGLGAGVPTGVGTSPRALAAGFLNGDTRLDLAVANFGSDNVSILFGNGDGTFSVGPTLALPAGAQPQGIALADLDANGGTDVATANFGLGQVSVILGDGLGAFLGAVPYAVGTNPTALAILNLDGSPAPDIAVTTFASLTGAQTLTILTNNGLGAFPVSSDHSVRNVPQAITPIDADHDGLVDLAIPCSSADAVVILLNRPPGPPVLARAPRSPVRDKPRAAAAGDFDGDAKLDLAVANSGASSVSLLAGDGAGGLLEYATLPAAAAEAVVAADFNLDGELDLAVSAPGSASVEIFFGVAGSGFAAPSAVGFVGMPDDLVAGDFDRDGDVDLAVCNRIPVGRVDFLRNNGPGVGLGTFTLVPGPFVGDKPTAIVAADFDSDGDLDLAVANDDSNDMVVLANTAGAFAVAQTLTLALGDQSPLSLAAGDFDANGTIDLAAAAFTGDRLHVYSNLGTAFATTPGTFDAPYLLQFVTTADVNLDGQPDLLAGAAGLSVLLGGGGLSFDPPQTVVAGDGPVAVVVADFNRDGLPDIAVVNELSDDVSMLSSSACRAQHLELSIQPNSCGGAPSFFDSQVRAFDDGGNLASCATNLVTASKVPGTGEPTATLGGPLTLPLAGGVVTWTGGNAHSLDKPGRRYKLQFQAAGMPPLQSRSFTLAPVAPQILGPASVCPGPAPGVYGTSLDFDTYAWTLTPTGPPPFAYTPFVSLLGPPLAGGYTLDFSGRIDGCMSPATRGIYFGSLVSVTLQILGGSSVCVDCIGGSAKAMELGGGTPVSRQWGYRTVSLGPITMLPGETGDTYVLKGASFPGPGSYIVVVTTTPACGAFAVSNEWTVSVVPNVPSGEVRHLAAASRGTSASGQNRLLWVNTTGPIEEVKIRWDEAPVGTTSCLPPASLNAPFDGEATILLPVSVIDNFLHTGLLLDTAYCYSVFVKVSGVYSAGRTVKARPFDSAAGPAKWAYSTGGTAVAPPTVSEWGVLAMSNDRTVHALVRGSAGGEWPGGWTPTELVGVAHSRSPVVPFVVPLAGSSTVLFAGDDAGFVHAIDAVTGLPPWPAQGPSLAMTGAPGGMFTQYSGNRDLLFVGTRDGNVDNSLRALKLADGTLAEAYAPGGFPGPIGPINGTPAIDYGTRRIYFASHARLGGDTLFCLEITDPPTLPVLVYKWSRNLGDVTGSPVLRGGRLYVGTLAGVIYSINTATDGAIGDDHTFSPADGPVKGFLFPDRRNDDLIFATDTKVWSISDDGVAMTLNWQWTTAGLNPSVILYWPGTSFVYVGSANGTLYQLDFSFPTVHPSFAKTVILGGGLGQVGAPSLDIGGLGPLKFLIVGSEPGVLYGVEVPFP